MDSWPDVNVHATLKSETDLINHVQDRPLTGMLYDLVQHTETFRENNLKDVFILLVHV